VTNFIKKYYFSTLAIATIIWLLGLTYTLLDTWVYLSLFVPIGSLLYYCAVAIKLSKRDKKGAEERRKKRCDRFHKLSLIETIVYYGLSLNIWIIGLLIFFYMPFSNIQTYSRIVEHLDWYQVKKELNELTELDSLYGNSREYTYPKVIIQDSISSLAKVHTKGEIAFGSFVYYLNNNNEVLNIDSLVVEIE